MEKRRKICFEVEDRLSSLPEDVLIEGIICLLPIRDLMKLSCVSKKFQELCFCSPSLKIDIPYPRVKANLIRKEEPSLLRFLDKSISSSSELRHLRIYWNLHRFHYVDWLSGFLSKALSSAGGLEHLSLRLSYSVLSASTFELLAPQPMTCTTSLKHLDLRTRSSLLLLVVLPPVTAAAFPNLQSLQLRDLKITDGGSFYRQLSAFKLLKQLVITNVHGVKNVCISSSSLESFTFKIAANDAAFDKDSDELIGSLRICGDKLHFIYIKWYHHSNNNYNYASPGSDNSIQILAPNLKRLIWEGRYVDDPSLKNLHRLEAACLYFTSSAGGTRDSYPCTPELFHILGNVNRLHLTDWNLKALCSYDCQAIPLSSVTTLGLYIEELRNEVVLDLVHLLTRIPRLKILYVTCCCTSVDHAERKYASGCNEKWWESMGLGFTETLEQVCIEIFTGDNELELARYLLKHGKALKQLVICKPNFFQPDAVTKLNRFRMSLLRLRPANRKKVVFRDRSFVKSLFSYSNFGLAPS